MAPSASLRLVVALCLGTLTGAGTPPPQGREVLLLYSSDEQSEMAPCDCEGGATGGLARRAAEFLQMEKDEAAVFKCSSGDVFAAPRGKATAQLRDLKIRAMRTAFTRMQYDALAAGETDLAFGADFLRRLRTEDGLPYLCANAYDKDGARLLEPYRVVEKGGVRVAFVAVLSPDPAVLGQYELEIRRNRITLRDPAEEVNALLPEIRAKSDLVVLLAHTGSSGAESLARSLAVDVILPGHRPPIEGMPRLSGRAVYASAGEKSDHFGKLRVTLGPDGAITAFSGEGVELPRSGPADEVIAVLASEVGALEYPDTLPDAEYVGADACRSCHEDVWSRWSSTKHAHAFEVLATSDDWDNAKCIGCHSTGAADKFFLMPERLDPARLNVQCEECHGPGGDHVVTRGPIRVDPKRCRVCHDPVNSPAFEWESYSARGIH